MAETVTIEAAVALTKNALVAAAVVVAGEAVAPIETIGQATVNHHRGAVRLPIRNATTMVGIRRADGEL